MSHKFWSISTEIVKDGLIFLFFYLAFSKFFNYHLFSDSIMAQPLPTFLRWLVIYTLPAALLLIAVSLLVPRWKLWGLYGAAGLMIVISLYMVLILLRFFHKIPCPCGGLYRDITWANQLFINIAIILALTYTILGLRNIQPKNLSYETTN